MANKYIKDLTGTTNPSLTGYTIFDDGITTYKTTLDTLKNTIVDGVSHTFQGNQTINGNISISGITKVGPNEQVHILNGSGSLVLGNSLTSPSYSNLSHFSSSNDENINLIIKDTTTSGSTTISGSGNFFTNPSDPSTGMKRYLSSYNTFLGGTSIPQITSSMTFSPNISYNIGATQGDTFTFYGPTTTTSSWSVYSNLIMGGQGINFGTLLNPMNKISGSVQVSSNILNNGTINVKGYNSNLIGPYNLTGNVINGGLLNLNSHSSSLNFNSNNVNSAVNVDNLYVPISGTITSSQSPRVNYNILNGNNHNIIFSGSNINTGQTKSFIWNLVQGEYITTLIGDGDSSNIVDTAIIGNSLVVTGSATMVDGNVNYLPNNTHGSAFFGRFNSLDGNKSKTAETIFAVGTGRVSSRKTGFLIDSGSNTHIDGTLNVTGSSTFEGNQRINGDLIVTGSITAKEFIVSSSVTHVTSLAQSGSTIFGDTLNDTHRMTGSVLVTGSLNVQGGGAIKDFLFVSGFQVIGTPTHHQGIDAEVLHVGSYDSYNIAHFQGNHNQYAQVNIKNINSGSTASTDLVLTANDGTEDMHYVNLGINSSRYGAGNVGSAYDGYLINKGSDFYIGTLSGSTGHNNVHLYTAGNWQNPAINVFDNHSIGFNTKTLGANDKYSFSGNTRFKNQVNIEDNLTVIGNVQVTGSFDVNQSIKARYFNSTDTGSAENYKVGDNVWLGDVGALNMLVVKGINDTGSAYVKFGLANTHQNPYIGHDSGEDANVLSVVADTTKFSNAVIVGSGSLVGGNPEMIHVYSSGSFNIANFVGNTNTYSQINVKNINNTAGASSDIVVTANNGNEDIHYVNLGINSSGWEFQTSSIGYQNDGYLYNVGQDMYVGVMEPASPEHGHLHLFSEGLWQNPSINIVESGSVAFNTGSVTSGYTYEFSGSAKFKNDLNVNGSVVIGTGIGEEGGEMMLVKPITNTNISGSGVIIDSYRDRVRIFEQGGSTRGAFLDITKQSNAVGSQIVTSPNLFSIQTITSASYAALTPVSGTLYIIID
jgi:hypothetical protein